MTPDQRTCRLCGCTDEDCSQCIAANITPCHWVEDDLCSRCRDNIEIGKRIDVQMRKAIADGVALQDFHPTITP